MLWGIPRRMQDPHLHPSMHVGLLVGRTKQIQGHQPLCSPGRGGQIGSSFKSHESTIWRKELNVSQKPLGTWEQLG